MTQDNQGINEGKNKADQNNIIDIKPSDPTGLFNTTKVFQEMLQQTQVPIAKLNNGTVFPLFFIMQPGTNRIPTGFPTRGMLCICTSATTTTYGYWTKDGSAFTQTGGGPGTGMGAGGSGNIVVEGITEQELTISTTASAQFRMVLILYA